MGDNTGSGQTLPATGPEGFMAFVGMTAMTGTIGAYIRQRLNLKK